MTPRKDDRSKSPAGYSGTPLPKKLGIKEGHRLAFLEAPDDFRDTLGDLPGGVTIMDTLKSPPYDVVVLFTREMGHLTRRFQSAARALDPAGGLWVAWPKRASGVPTDVTEDTVRQVALAVGLVDNKVCAIDQVWSGLRCVYRLKDRVKPGC